MKIHHGFDCNLSSVLTTNLRRDSISKNIDNLLRRAKISSITKILTTSWHSYGKLSFAPTEFSYSTTKYLSEEVDIVNPPFLVDPAPPFAICYEGPAVPLGYNNYLALVWFVDRQGSNIDCAIDKLCNCDWFCRVAWIWCFMGHIIGRRRFITFI